MREYGQAACAIFDTDKWTIEFLRVPYDGGLTESKAAAAGYRIGVLTDRWYTFRRRVLRGLQRIRGAARAGP
jgi:hypothetical protein